MDKCVLYCKSIALAMVKDQLLIYKCMSFAVKSLFCCRFDACMCRLNFYFIKFY